MAKNLVKRVEKRLERENKPYEPMYLLEKSKEGIMLLYRNPKSKSWLFRWCFLTQWRGTIWQSFKHHRLIWIGGGFNPDYTQVCSACTASGNCGALTECAGVSDCRSFTTCSPNCPPPSDPNSSLVSNTCNCTVGGCTCSPKIAICGGTIGTCATPTGTCGYNCNAGYVWNGSTCVLVGGVLQRLKVGVGL